jgi:hypothetical protein
MATAFKNFLTSNVGTSPTTVVTGGAAQTTVYSLTVANTLTPAATISVSVSMVSGATTAFLCKNAPVPAGGTIIVVGEPQKVALENGDIIQVSTSNAASADVIVSVVELT